MTRRPGEKGSVCIVRHSFYPFELNVKREAEALLEDGFSVHVICLRNEGEAAREVVDGVEVHRLPVGHRRGKILRYLFEYNAFFVLAKLRLIYLQLRHRFRAIQVNTMPDYLVFCTIFPRLLGAKIVLHMHEPMPELFATMFSPRKARFLVPPIRLAERMSLRYAHSVLTVTRDMRDNFGRRGADVNKITVIVNVPDDRVFRIDHYEDTRARIAAGKKEERRRGTFRVLTHGAVEERYGPDLIVRAVARLRDEIPGIEFRFMGGGSHVDAVLALADELGVADRVHFLGFVPFETMVEEILSADVTVVPMQANPYSRLVHTNKMYEYVALQRPVVASRLDSVASYFPDDALVYFAPGDDADLARALHHVFAHPEETDARIDAATAVYETYRWSRERKKYLGVYHALLSS